MVKVVRYAQIKFSDVLCAFVVVHLLVFFVLRLVLLEDICVWIVLLGDQPVEIWYWFVLHKPLVFSLNDLGVRVHIHYFVLAFLHLLFRKDPPVADIVLFDGGSCIFKIFNSFVAGDFLGDQKLFVFWKSLVSFFIRGRPPARLKPATYSQVGHLCTKLSPASTNSSGVSLPCSKNTEVLRS